MELGRGDGTGTAHEPSVGRGCPQWTPRAWGSGTVRNAGRIGGRVASWLDIGTIPQQGGEAREAGPRTWNRPVTGVSAGGPREEARPALPGSALLAPHSQVGTGRSLSGGRVTQWAVAGGGRAQPARADRPVLSQPLHQGLLQSCCGTGSWWPRGRPRRVPWSALTAEVSKHPTALRKRQ